MKHLDVDRVIEAVTGRASDAERVHVDTCDRCRSEVESWRKDLEALRELEAESMSDAELHRLRVMFRQLGPARERPSLVARLIRRSEPAAAAAVRGGVTSTFEEYQAGPFGVVLQIRPAGHDLFDVHGQLSTDAGPVGDEAVAVLSSADGWVGRATLDAHGEFRLRGVPAGPYALFWSVRDTHVRIDQLWVGDDDAATEV
jgi:hypothetical protein